jgi:AcrR family transcriptional regulator
MVKNEDPGFSTEEKILEAAKKVFVQNGLEGTSMQQIADEANINKSLLHYYFRTKEKLFGTVFKYAFKFIVPQIQDILNSDLDLFGKIDRLVSEYIDMLMKNRFVPAFILHEINRNPDSIVQVMKDAGINPQVIVDQLEAEIKKGRVRQINPKHLIVNIISLCVFPVAARPLAQRLFFENDEKKYQEFLGERKQIVSEFIINALKIKE